MVPELTLRELHKRLKPVHGGVWQDCFAVAYLMRTFKISEEEAAEYCAFGSHDYGFDAYYLSEQRRNLYLYQFKYSNDHKQFAPSLERIATDGLERIFGDPKQDQQQNRLLDSLKAALYEQGAVVERVFIQCVFLGDVRKAEDNKHLESLREDLESRRHFLETYFKRPVDLAFEYVSESKNGQPKSGPSITTSHHEFPLDLGEQYQKIATEHGHELYLGTIPLVQLAGYYTAMKHKLFARNIRFGLGHDTAPNRAIRRSLEAILFNGTDDPAAFTFFHNGVTISAEALRTGPEMRIVEPRVLNGAQSITSVEKFLADNAKNPMLVKAQDKLSKLRVIARVIVTPPGEADFVTRVTINNNRQNPVEPWNLRANDAIQLQFEDAFFEQLQIFYERQEGAFEAMSTSELEEAGVQPGRAIELTRFAKTILASQGEVKKMSNLQDLFESDPSYQKTFRSSYLDCDLRRWVLAYKVQRALNVMTSAIHEQGETKYWYIFQARNLLWALAIQGMLNESEKKLEELCREYGTDLKLPTGFREYLRNLASSRLRFIVGAVAEKDFAEELKLSKTKWLTATDTFDQCMVYARKLYKWEKASI